MSYVWFIICKRPVPLPPPRPGAQPFGVTKIDMRTGKQTFTPGGVVLLPKAPNPNDKPWVYRHVVTKMWLDLPDHASAYWTKDQAEAEAMLLVAEEPHLIGHVEVRREESKGPRIVYGKIPRRRAGRSHPLA